MPPMAKPISACASAGASLIPSPDIPVAPYRCCMSLIAASLSSGNKLPRASSIPACTASALAVAALSPVNITGVTPKSLSSVIAAFDESLMVSATANKASTPDVEASSVTVRPASSWVFSTASKLGLPCPAPPYQCHSIALPPYRQSRLL